MRTFIIGTDWWTDCDDAVALRILFKAHRENQINLLGIGINACMEYSVTSMEGFMNLEGVEGIPLGIDSDATDFGGKPPYQERLSQYAKMYSSNEDVQDAVRMYRQILSEIDEKTEIIEIGYPQVLSNLLDSKADDITDKSGLKLVEEKVSKIWMMAGKWDEEKGLENNFKRNARSREASHRFLNMCPVPVTLLGWEVGYDVITGGNLKKDDHLYQVLCDHKSYEGRMSWDPMLVLLALKGDEQEAGYDTVSGVAHVDAKTGENSFSRCEDGIFKYVVRNKDKDYYKKEIDILIER